MHKEQIEGFLADHIRELVNDDVEVNSFARHLSFILEGAITRSGLEGNGRQMREAKDLVAKLLKTL